MAQIWLCIRNPFFKQNFDPELLTHPLLVLGLAGLRLVDAGCFQARFVGLLEDRATASSPGREDANMSPPDLKKEAQAMLFPWALPPCWRRSKQGPRASRQHFF
eukprot:s2_g37.t1